jgi:hypothetical protein
LLDLQFEKGPNLTGIDPESGRLIRLFNPRLDLWEGHFQLVVDRRTLTVEIHVLTSVGRTTAKLFGMNNDFGKSIRYELWQAEMLD